MSVISVKNVHKKFKVYFDKSASLKEKILFQNRNYYEERFVLRGISMEIEKGEVVGLIGKNGCGKSTMLKLLSRIMYPDEGTVTMTGRVASLIELGAGFHPDMSGRENIYTNASIFGLTSKEIDQRIEDIINFSELHDYIDNPVRTYSSGMYMRLAFSVAIHVDADILLIDEILAVGDANFQAKCFNHLNKLKVEGITIVIVTHDLGSVEKFCDRAVLINEGEIVVSGIAVTVIDKYLKYVSDQSVQNLRNQENNDTHPEPDEFNFEEIVNLVSDDSNLMDINTTANHFGLKNIIIKKAHILNFEKTVTNVLVTNESFSIEIFYQVNSPLDYYVFGIGIYTMDLQCLYGTNTKIDRIKVPHTKKEGKIVFHCPSLNLLSGKYILNIAIVDKNEIPMDFYRNYLEFEVISSNRSVGYFNFDHNWIVD